jgi:hypothetical protein
MKKIWKGVLSVGFTMVVAGGTAGHAQQRTFIYPAKGQTQAQQSSDEVQCYSWARQETGYDPSLQAPSGSGTQTGGALRGAAGGALGGVVIGAIAGDAGKGAAIGAGVGAVGGGLRQRDANNQRVNAQQQAIDEYNRAFQTCMTGRGYTVK